jgi:hypothetical protein
LARAICGSVLALIIGTAPAFSETTTTTTTVTHPDGTTTQTVEETSTEEQASPATENQPNLIGPAGATGVIRRSDRRQDRRDGNPRID